MASNEAPAGGGGQAGIYALLTVILVLVVGAILYFAGVFGTRGGSRDIDADVKIEAPSGGAQNPN